MSQSMLNSGGRRSNRFVVRNQSGGDGEEVGQCVDDYDDGDGTGWKITRSGLRKTGELRRLHNQAARSRYMSFEYFVIFARSVLFCWE